ncbi:AIR synthase related protein [Streptomyces sp. NPDC001351]|uniref:AIR synthase related protein n=1 Tax=Streptomyces sp. NPDC001351 TaxID=3364564 RepID=UPI0036C412BD
MTPAATTIGDLPEKEFISSVLAQFAETAERDKFEDRLVIELGSDPPDRPVVVLNVDHPSYVRGEFRDLADYRFYGRWVAAATGRDVISMGVRPAGFAVALSAPLDLEITKVEAIYEGLREVLDDYGARLSGGNVDANALEMVGIAWGVGRHDRLVRRGGAAVGGRILVTCDLGRGSGSRHIANPLKGGVTFPSQRRVTGELRVITGKRRKFEVEFREGAVSWTDGALTELWR